MVQPPAAPVLLTQRESLCLSLADPVDDDLLQAMDIVTSGIASSCVELPIREDQHCKIIHTVSPGGNSRGVHRRGVQWSCCGTPG